MFIIQLLDRVTLINVLTATIEPFWVNPFGVCVYILDCWMNWTMYSWKTLQADKTKCILFKMWFLSIFIYLNCMRKWFVNYIPCLHVFADDEYHKISFTDYLFTFYGQRITHFSAWLCLDYINFWNLFFLMNNE